jgi:TPP-dependent 2-oxoacid decarboxylase
MIIVAAFWDAVHDSYAFSYTPDGYEHLVFVYNGGPYIDVHMDGSKAAYDTINVWDYDLGLPKIFTLDEFKATCDERLEERLEEARSHG